MSGAAKIRIARARGEVDQAKARLMATLEEAKARLAPGRLASNAVQSAKDKSIVVADDAVTAVKDNPGLTAGVATMAALYIARKPLFSAVRGLFRSSEPNAAPHKTDKASRRKAGDMENLNG
ncbi:ElaB/YqjD/DUF883 family membrane-anchored ribosome-binding protein [Sphingomonas kaistensis]|uniref:ElaB/YqjD/DUF883 family membrane-anchored ribosome-binding protein n=1 Tax=Sphingomonas kaistensis TaxID=298708 RepID=A0A7X5Y754_9SPHN|nr:hypothetical protein [Sphingomonas kaistensis]NJC06030.1 ElaB/YqjD/DUF883 family membrane-anchored ribosome-binding protein [Sphingomonas kaistensis]